MESLKIIVGCLAAAVCYGAAALGGLALMFATVIRRGMRAAKPPTP